VERFNEEIISNAIRWSIQRGNRTGRTAWQYILQISSEKNLKLKF
jgi:Predicted ATPase (AAA+ superfamily)